LVDIEGGEFMHGNILDANSTNKLINQSIKDAIDNGIVEGDYVLFSKKIKVSDIITDATTDSSLNTVLSKKVDTEAFNSFTSSVSG
jgi:hypothetical protein